MNLKKVNKELLKLNVSKQKLSRQRLFSKSWTISDEKQQADHKIMHSQLDKSIVCKTNDKNWGIRMKNRLLVMMVMLIMILIASVGMETV